ncbi:MAG TPA: ABC transporter ATP-binding protein [Acidimicrobiales bacterium]|nr:ABC transporter ATP-binding protein [Acidimicrobiales bacterium]
MTVSTLHDAPAATTGAVVPLLSVRNLRREFGGVVAVDDASFDVLPGTITSLIGPNGAGKSTAVGIIGGGIRPTKGTVQFAGEDLTGLPPYARAERGLIRTFQLSSQFSKLTVLENLLAAAPHQRGEQFRVLVFGKRLWREEQDRLLERAYELLVRFSMFEMRDEYAGNLSGGQKRLVEIMRALMANPKMVLLDEPMAGVNPTLARAIEGYLLDLAAEGVTLLLVEHELDVVERLSDNVVVMAQGRTIATGSMTELRENEEVVRAYLEG